MAADGQQIVCGLPGQQGPTQVRMHHNTGGIDGAHQVKGRGPGNGPCNAGQDGLIIQAFRNHGTVAGKDLPAQGINDPADGAHDNGFGRVFKKPPGIDLFNNMIHTGQLA